MADDKDDISSKIDGLSTCVIEQRTLFRAHCEQYKEDHRQLVSDIKDLTQAQHTTNERLIEYNALLKVHIEGVQQLREMNELLRKQIENDRIATAASNEKMNDRLNEVLTPLRLAKRISRIAGWAITGAQWIAFISAGGGLLYGLAKLAWKIFVN